MVSTWLGHRAGAALLLLCTAQASSLRVASGAAGVASFTSATVAPREAAAPAWSEDPSTPRVHRVNTILALPAASDSHTGGAEQSLVITVQEDSFVRVEVEIHDQQVGGWPMLLRLCVCTCCAGFSLVWRECCSNTNLQCALVVVRHTLQRPVGRGPPSRSLLAPVISAGSPSNATP